MCIGIYIFNFKKQVKSKKNRRIQKKVKETKEGNRISTENRLKSKKNLCYPDFRKQEYIFLGANHEMVKKRLKKLVINFT